MAGDPFRDAMRAAFEAVRQAAAIPWLISDSVNTTANPDASGGYLELEFPGAFEGQYTFGAPGANLHSEQGQITVRVVAPLGIDRDLAELYAAAIRTGFRMKRIPMGAQTIRITSTGSMGGGHTEGGMWAESIALAYQLFNVG